MKIQNVFMKKRFAVQRSPTLNTVIMVEETLRKSGEIMTIGQLKRILPRQVMHQTLMGIIDYLEYSGKIIVDRDKVIWAFKPNSKLKQMKSLTVKKKF